MWSDTRRREIWTSIGLSALMGVYLYSTFQYSDRSPPGVPNARTFPLLLVSILTVLLIAMLWTSRALAGKPRIAAEEDEEDVRLVEDPSLARLALLIAILLLYLWIMPRIGFLPSTVLMGTVMQMLIFRAHWLMSLAVTAGMAAGAYWLFSEVLSIPMP